MKHLIKKILKEEYSEKEELVGDENLETISDQPLKTDPKKGIVAPSKKVISDVCEKEKFCKKQGPITFGQLRSLVESAKRENLLFDLGEGGYKAAIRLLPWFFPQIAVAGFVGSSIRAFNKILRPSLEDTRGYKRWWGRTVMKVMDIAEGDIPRKDPISKIFFISDGLLHMLDRKFKIKFARYIAELAASKPDSEPVPEYFVENELRKWVNQKFLLNPPLPPKTLNESEDWSWVQDIPGTEEYGQKYRFFDIYVCDNFDFDDETCWGGYSAFIKIPIHEVDEIWDGYIDYYAGPQDEGMGVIEWAIDNEQLDSDDTRMVEYVREIDDDEYMRATGDPDLLINESEEDDWGWVKDIEIKTNLTPAQIYNRYESFPVEVVGPYIAGQFNDVVYEGGKLYLESDGWFDFVDLFEDRESNYGRMGRYLARAVLSDDDYWEPYSTSDLVNDWVDDVWHLVNDDPVLFEYIKEYIKKNDFIGKPLDSEEENFREDMLDDNNLLGDLINEEDMFHNLKMELKWAYGSAYNQAASNNVYEAATDAIFDIFGKGEWIQKKNQRGYDIHLLKFDATDVILESVANSISDCWYNCRRWFDPKKHYDPEEHEDENEAFEDYCQECVDKPFDDWGSFLDFYSNYLNERDEGLYPSYDEWPSSEDLKDYFREDVYGRI